MLAVCGQPVLKSLADALEQRDPYTRNHGLRVAIYSFRLAVRLGLSEQETFWAALGGFLHDIGKLGFSDRIFSNADARLSARMRAEVKCHPVTGALLLNYFAFLKPAAPLILYHHERVDGMGYPFGLTEHQIPLGARIISIADCFDAMTTDRPYQKRKSVPQAMAMLKDMAGSCLAGELVETFINEIGTNGLA